MSARYDGKPLLRLVDGFVLDAIGRLQADEEQALVALEPEMRQVTGAAGGWRQIVAAQMRFPDGLAAAIREIWEKGRVKFVAAQGHEPDPVQFTRSFVDSKFPH
ncbi:hypothetical protein [Sphingomonas sp.]|uniref:hypothetical protein n=1 Tax=Sphingomonas sp. TaxID=28214 RepID=UPI002DD6A195|nr:hypothetical protein [Sphingomonas sp.]